MLPQHVLLALVAACSAIPLNINLGAYSPALVVGDGEISVGDAKSASNIMETLASGASAGAEGQQRPGQQPNRAEAQQREGGEQNGQGEQPAEGKRSPNLVRTIDHIGKRSPAHEQLSAIEGAMDWIKRDIGGFNAALSYAREAMKNTPKIELGTEEAGVGMIVNAGLSVPTNSGANGAKPEGKRTKAKRGEVVAEESETPKMTLVAITEV